MGIGQRCGLVLLLPAVEIHANSKSGVKELCEHVLNRVLFRYVVASGPYVFDDVNGERFLVHLDAADQSVDHTQNLIVNDELFVGD